MFDICSEHARRADWTEFAPTMRSGAVRFGVVDEDEWQARPNGMLYGAGEGGWKIHRAGSLKLVPGMDPESVVRVGWGVLVRVATDGSELCHEP